MATAAIASNSEVSNVTPTSGGKRLVKSKSGLKIVCQHDRESAPWDMAEPQWTPDKEVGGISEIAGLGKSLYYCLPLLFLYNEP